MQVRQTSGTSSNGAVERGTGLPDQWRGLTQGCRQATQRRGTVLQIRNGGLFRRQWASVVDGQPQDFHLPGKVVPGCDARRADLFFCHLESRQRFVQSLESRQGPGLCAVSEDAVRKFRWAFGKAAGSHRQRHGSAFGRVTVPTELRPGRLELAGQLVRCTAPFADQVTQPLGVEWPQCRRGYT